MVLEWMNLRVKFVMSVVGSVTDTSKPSDL